VLSSSLRSNRLGVDLASAELLAQIHSFGVIGGPGACRTLSLERLISHNLNVNSRSNQCFDCICNSADAPAGLQLVHQPDYGQFAVHFAPVQFKRPVTYVVQMSLLRNNEIDETKLVYTTVLGSFILCEKMLGHVMLSDSALRLSG